MPNSRLSGRAVPGVIALAAMLVLSACSDLPARGAAGDDDDSPLIALQVAGPAARYLAIAEPANITLDAAFDGLEDAADDGDLARAQADFRLAATTERAFDRDLLAIALPPSVEATARALVNVNEARASITEQAAASTTLAEVAGYRQDITVANDVVEDQVGLIRRQLGLPPADTS